MPVLVIVRSESDRTRTRPRHRQNPVFKACVKLSLIGLRFDVRSYFNIARPPVEFRRDRSPSGTRTVDHSGTVFGLSSDVSRCFKSRCRATRFPSRLRITALHNPLVPPSHFLRSWSSDRDRTDQVHPTRDQPCISITPLERPSHFTRVSSSPFCFHPPQKPHLLAQTLQIPQPYPPYSFPSHRSQI